MKAARQYEDCLQDILRYAEMGERIVAGLDFEEFCRNEEKTLAAIQVLLVIGEASKGLPGRIKKRYPEVPWKDVAGTRDKLIHAYYLIDMETVWRTLKEDIPSLRRSVARMIEDLKRDPQETDD